MNADFDSLFYQVGTVFSPAAPVDKKSLFSGRIMQLTRVIDAINTRGQHVIIYGERGVGKTSLANILHETLESSGMGGAVVKKVNCDSSDTYSSLWRKALQEITYLVEQDGIGFDPQTKQYLLNLSAGLGEEISPNDICRKFRGRNVPIVIIFDEFDRVEDEETNRLFTDTMKSLSDNSIGGTLILVGVGDDVDELIHSHESIGRSLVQIKIPRMSRDELKGIVDTATKRLSMRINEEALRRILLLSQGLPHYTHLLGLESFRAALLKNRLEVILSDAQSAVRQAVLDAQQTIISSYQKATSSPHKGHLYKEVLLACALAEVDDLGFFAATDVRVPLSKLMDKKYDIAAFGKHLNNFCAPERGRVLLKTGTKRSYRYRFRNPMLRPFVVIRGIVDGHMREAMLETIPVYYKE